MTSTTPSPTGPGSPPDAGAAAPLGLDGRAWGGLLAGTVAAVGWSVNFSLTRESIDEFGPIVFALYGSIITGLVLALGLTILRKWQGSWRDAPPILLGGAIGLAVNWSAFSIAQQNAPVAHVAFLASTTSLWLILFTAIGQRRMPGRPILLAAALATAGVALLASQQPDGGAYPNLLLGDAFALLLAASYAVFTLLLQRGMRSFNAPSAIALAQVTTAPTLLVIALVTGGFAAGNLAALTPEDWGQGLVVHLIGGTAAPTLFFVSVAWLGAVRAGFLLYLQPVLGAFFGWVLLGEALGWLTLAGGVLIIAAVLLSEFGGRREEEAVPVAARDGGP